MGRPKALVTGGAGFVGSHLVDGLLADGYEVHVVDSLTTGTTANLAHIRTRRMVFRQGDVSKTKFERYSEIFHLASPASPVAYQRQQRATLITNSLGTLRTLEIARRSGARYLLASTSEVYGEATVHPQPETLWGNVNPIGPRSSYDEGKRFAEALTTAYVRELGIDARIVRIFNTYGPRMGVDDGRMPSAFIAAALRGDDIPVHGAGTQTRSLCFISDLVSGLRAAMRNGVQGEVYNLGRPDEISVIQFARLVLELTGSSSGIAFQPSREEEIPRRCPDITKARVQLGWSPTVPMRSGVGQTITWFRSQPGLLIGGDRQLQRGRSNGPIPSVGRRSQARRHTTSVSSASTRRAK